MLEEFFFFILFSCFFKFLHN